MSPDNSSDANIFSFDGKNLSKLTESVDKLINSENATRKQVAPDKAVDPSAESMKHAFKSLISSLMVDDHGGTFNLDDFKKVAGKPTLPYNMLLTALSNSSDISCRLFACEWLATLASVQKTSEEDKTLKSDSGYVDVSAEGSDNFFEKIKKNVSNTPAFFERKWGVFPQKLIEDKLPEYLRRLGKWESTGDSPENAKEVLGQIKHLRALLRSPNLNNSSHVIPGSVEQLSTELESDATDRYSQSSGDAGTDREFSIASEGESEDEDPSFNASQSSDVFDKGRLERDVRHLLSRFEQSDALSIHDFLLFSEVQDRLEAKADLGSIMGSLEPFVKRLAEGISDSPIGDSAISEQQQEFLNSLILDASMLQTLDAAVSEKIKSYLELILPMAKEASAMAEKDTIQNDFTKIDDFIKAGCQLPMSANQQASLKAVLLSVSQHKQAVSDRKLKASLKRSSINKHSQAVKKHTDDAATIESHLREHPIYNVELMQLLAVVSGHEDADILQSTFSLPRQQNVVDSSVDQGVTLAMPKNPKEKSISLQRNLDGTRSLKVQRENGSNREFSELISPRLPSCPRNGPPKKSRG